MDRPAKLVVDVAALAGGQALMVKYMDTSKYDGQAGWFLPDDYLAHLEHPDEAAARILSQQGGLSGLTPSLATIDSFGNGAWHLVFHYRIDLDAAPDVTPGPNVASMEWFPLDALPDADDVAHGGWALDVIKDLTG